MVAVYKLEETINRKTKQLFQEYLAPIQSNIETLERLFREASKDAKIADDFTRIQRLIDELDEACNTEKILLMQAALDKVIMAVSDFLDYKTDIPDDLLSKIKVVIKAIEDANDIYNKKRKSLLERVEQARKAAIEMSTILDISDRSNKAQMKRWAEAFEIFADSFEIVVEPLGEEKRELSSDFSKALTELCLMILSKTSDSYAYARRRDEYRNRIRCAARSTLYSIEQQESSKVSQRKADLWDNPPEASGFLKEALATVKDSFKVGEQWDGAFYH